MKAVKVTLRKREYPSGKIALYLDFYPAIRNPRTMQMTRREYLGIYLMKSPRTASDRKANAIKQKQAEAIRDDLQTIADKRKEGTLVWNVGHLRGALNAFAGAEQTQQRLSNMLEQFLSTEKNYIMLNNGSAKAFAEMPKLQKDLLVENISVQVAEHAYLMSGVELNSEQMQTLEKERQKIDS